MEPLLPRRLTLLGPPMLAREGRPPLPFGPERRLQVLALLGYDGGWVGRDRLAALFWPGRDPGAARANLRKVLHELRALGIQGLEEDGAGLRWRPASDVAAFHAACQAGHWFEAAAVGAGSLMAGLDGGVRGSPAFDEWLQLERQQWAGRWRAAALQAVAAADAASAWQLAEQLLAADPLDEEGVAVALRAAAALGRPAHAQSIWQRYRTRLADDFGLEPAPALQALAAGAPASASAPAASSELGSFVGRSQEQQQLASLLGHARLVTVIGPGGAGKSRLVRQAIAPLGARFAEGAVWVPLDGLDTPAAVPGRIAAALGLQLAAHGDPLALLTRQLGRRSLLLVLDGFEPVIDAAEAVVQLLAAAPGLRVVVTSRERLEVAGEWLLKLDGLSLPAASATGEQAAGCDAVRLFTARAQAVNPGFDAAADHAAVVEICRRCDGLPLALELAADWVRLMSASEIARQVASGIELLDGSPAGGHGPGRGMRAVLEHSWQLLTPAERRAFASLAVFRGAFSRDASRHVAEVPLPLLAALLDKSMLRTAAAGQLDMHPLVHAWALEKLAALPQQAQLAERHSRWFMAWLSRPGAAVAAQRENLLGAWHQAVARRDHAAVESALLELPWAVVNNGRLNEAITLFGGAALAFADDPGASGARGRVTAAVLRAHQAWLLLWLERYPQAVAMSQAAWEVLAPAGHAAGCVVALRTLGHAARRQGRYGAALQYLDEARSCAQQAGLAGFVAALHDAMAMVLNLRGEHAAAREHIHQALALNDARGDGVQRMYNQYNLSQSHSLAGNAEAARPWADAALASGERSGQTFMRPYLLAELARVQADQGQLDGATAHATQALACATDTGDSAAQAGALDVQARIALARADTPAARAAIVAAARLCLGTAHVVSGALLVPVAARAFAGQAGTEGWLQALRLLPEAPQPACAEACALLGSAAPPAATAARSLQDLLGEIAALARSGTLALP